MTRRDCDMVRSYGYARRRNRMFPTPAQREAARDYLLDMIREMAILARQTGETPIAIYLEAILAARRAELRGEP